MTTTIRGKAGKSALRELLDQHDECLATIETLKFMVEPLRVCDRGTDEGCLELSVTRDEIFNVLFMRRNTIETKLENLGLKIGDEVMENAQ
jgi:hypothetical protein